jgi:type VI secretion system secreted protein Hcp
LGLGGLAALAPGGAAMGAPIPTDPSSDFYLKLDGVEGESTAELHPNELELLTWAFGVSSSASPLVSGGGGAGKSKPTDLVFVSYISKASPKLYQLVCTGKHVKTAVLSAVKIGDSRQQYLTVTMSDVLVTSYQVAPGESDGVPLDVVHLDYAKISYSYRPQRNDGSIGDPITFGFDFAANKAI